MVLEEKGISDEYANCGDWLAFDVTNKQKTWKMIFSFS